MSVSHLKSVPEQVLRDVASRIADEFVAIAKTLPDDQFAAALCPSHQRSASLAQRAA